MYLYQWTRPDLGYAVTFLSRYLHKAGDEHMQAARHTLLYLQGTESLGIRYTCDINSLCIRGQDLNVVYGLSDSDFAGCKDTVKSTSGHIVLLNGGPIAYYSGRQTWTNCLLFWLRLIICMTIRANATVHYIPCQ